MIINVIHIHELHAAVRLTIIKIKVGSLFNVITIFYSILCRELNVYLKQIKVILSTVKKNRIFHTSDRYDLYFFHCYGSNPRLF